MVRSVRGVFVEGVKGGGSGRVFVEVKVGGGVCGRK